MEIKDIQDKFSKTINKREDLALIIKELNCLKGVEVGVHKGEFSEIILGSTTIYLNLIDPWGDYRKTNGDEIFAEAKERLKKFDKRTNFIRVASPEAATLIEDNSIDFIYLDGDHTIEGVALDLNAWWLKLKEGGIFAGHDYCKRHKHYGVIEAVDEFVNKKGYKIEVINDGKWPTWWFLK